MAKKKFISKLKAFLSGDETADFSSREKAELDKMLKQRKMELVAQKKLRDLEKKFEPKEKRKASDVFSQIKSYRQKNLNNRQQRLQRTTQAKNRFKDIERKRKSGRKTPKSDGLSEVAKRIKEMEEKRKKRMLGK